ncbi:MAG: topoisomerase DNA-binding C4 zinc finger domain-containing protein, partial [Alphaproteobacteria bacterium]|nr:topoisomerase DNA-binding C4 zinc finger domain-containing protein [Alphaproteobacteria bacterium]
VLPEQHFTQPPPRYSEASLVKKMEELGIGRPSTYASILQVLRDRNYVRMDKKRFIPEDRGRVVTTFLEQFFAKYVDYDFTANLEEELDAIAAGHVAWKEALRLFWVDFSKAVEDTKGLTITEVLDHLDKELGPHFFPPREDGKDPRQCPACGEGRLSLKLGKFGAFIGCSRYPDCRHTQKLEVRIEGEEDEDPTAAALANEPKILGTHPETGRTVSLRKGPYGPYVQIDLPPEHTDKKDKPKRQGLPKGVNAADVTLDVALGLLALPRDVGEHPETGKMIQAGIGRFGPYLKHDGVFSSLPKDDDLMTIGINRAVTVIAEAAEKKAARAASKGAKGDAKPPAKAQAKAKPKTKPKTKPKKPGAKKKKAS